MEVLNSFNNIVCFVFLTTQFYSVVSQEMITIIRSPGGGGLWTDLDQFKLPDSKCNSDDCYNWKAFPVSRDCHCECSNRQSATFGFYSGSWTCMPNTEVRKQTGMLCKYKFQNEKDIYPLRIVEQGKQYDVILPSDGCSVVEMTSRYFTCDGGWAGIDSQSFNQWLSIQYKRLSENRSIYGVQIRSNISTALLGRIISLGITCPQEHSCLLFKLQGTFQCVENVTSIITSPSSAITTAKAYVTTLATSATAATSVPNATANPNNNGEKGKPETSGSSWIVVGVAVTLVIIVVIVIAIVAYVYRKRKRGESVWLVDYISSRVRKSRSTQPKKKTAPDETQEDPEYAKVHEEQRRNVPVDQAGGITYDYAIAGDSSSNENQTNYDFKDRHIHDFMLKMRDQNKSGQSNTQRGSEGRNIDESGPDLGYINMELTGVPSTKDKKNAATISADDGDFVSMSNNDREYEEPIEDGGAPDTAHGVYQELKDNNVVSEYQSLDKHTRK